MTSFNNEFRCKKSNECISREKLCDQIEDCPNGEDELDCDQLDHHNGSICQPNEFKCHNSMECIVEYLVCDEKCLHSFH